MHQLTRPLVGLVALTMALFPALPMAALTADDVKLEGQFVWVREDGDIPGDLTAILTPDGENSWTVAFHFVWEDEPRVYTGTATGSLTDGTLEGTALGDNPERQRTFRFAGTVENGTFTGTHQFVRKDGSVRDGGTLTLSHAP